MKLTLKRGSTSKRLRLLIQNSTTGDPLTGLLYNSGGLTAYYIREGDSTTTAITLVTATVGTWVSGGFKEIDATNMPGIYEFDIPNAALSSGDSVLVYLKGATNMIPYPLEIELVAMDPQDSVRLGLTSLPNAAAGASGGLPTGDASGKVLLQPTQTGVTIPTVTNLTNGVAVTTNNDKTGYGLSSGERSSLAAAIEAAIVNEGDATHVMQAIADKIAAANPDLSGLTTSAIASAVWAAGARTLTGFAFTVSTTDASNIGAIKAKTDLIPADPATNTQVNTRLASASYTAPPSVENIKDGLVGVTVPNVII